MLNRVFIRLIGCLFIGNLYSQEVSVVADMHDRQPIAFVNIWVKHKTTGVSSNESGEFSISAESDSDTLVFSSIGYKNLQIPINQVSDSVFLERNSIILNELNITPSNSQTVTIGSIRKAKVDHYFGRGKNPWLIARFIEFDPKLESTRFLRSIEVLTNSDVDDAQMNLQILGVQQNGAPGEPLVNERILFDVRKGKKVTEIGLSDHNIFIPENGLFIAFEWLEKEENEHIENGRISFEPAIGMSEENTLSSWLYIQGKWNQLDPKSGNKFLQGSVALSYSLSN